MLLFVLRRAVNLTSLTCAAEDKRDLVLVDRTLKSQVNVCKNSMSSCYNLQVLGTIQRTFLLLDCGLQ